MESRAIATVAMLHRRFQSRASGLVRSPRRPLGLALPRAIAAASSFALSLALSVAVSLALPSRAAALAATATLAGRVVDESGAVVAHVDVVVVDLATGLERKTETSDRGEFVLLGLAPARYQLTAQRDGFAPLQVPDLVLHVNDQAVLHLTLKISPIGEVVIVDASRVRVSPSPVVSTVVDRPLVNHLPLNARSVQSLIWLVPGMVRTSGSGYGQFSANGQRDNANYLTIDGTSANVSAGHTLPAAGGGVPATSRLGTTNNLISVDALESVRIQTSSYAAEFGRTPGAQIAITSRSGTNHLHGAAFEYVRHDALDANDWFANSANLDKAALRHHQFGGVLGGPFVRNRAFFFGAYEGLRLRQPATSVTAVPSMRVREMAAPAVRPLLQAFPVPTTSRGDGPLEQHIASFSTPARLDAASVRLDYLAGTRLTVFGRYNQSPSDITTAATWNAAAHKRHIDRTRTITGGLHAVLSDRLHNELRVNYSSNARTESGWVGARDGAAPLTRSDVLATPQRTLFWGLFFNSAAIVYLSDEQGALARQVNIVDNLTAIAGDHQIKLGVDIRHLALWLDSQDYLQAVHFDTEADIVNGVASMAYIEAKVPRAPVMRNYSAYVQDTWRVTPRLTLTSGVRWEANPAAFDREGRRPFVARGLDDPSTTRVMLLPEGEPLYRTRRSNFAPRVGASYQLAEGRPDRDTVLRGGAGLFYDLGNAATLWAFDANAPFISTVLRYGVRYPLSAADAAAPPYMPATGTPDTIVAVDPNLQLPYTWQWNAAVEQSLGPHQTLTVTYVGAAGRRLLQRQYFASLPGVPSITGGSLITSDGTSAYRALQVQFQRRLSHGLAGLASYSWAHAQDAQSDDLNLVDDQDLWGDADFDVRHSVAAGLTYDLPKPRRAALARLLGDCGIDAMLRASSAYPFTPRGPMFVMGDGTMVSALPDVVPGAPIWIADPAAAGGRRLNPDAFTLPAAGQQGNAGRNRLRGFPFSQVDLAIRRAFALRGGLRLSVRAEAFNVLNHPNFLNPSADHRLGTPDFGRATQMANRGFGGVQGPTLQQFYESGGPRSMQLSVRLEF
jgi:hypothetical protein